MFARPPAKAQEGCVALGARSFCVGEVVTKEALEGFRRENAYGRNGNGQSSLGRNGAGNEALHGPTIFQEEFEYTNPRREKQMNKLKKLLVGLAAVALPVLVAAPAMAQGVVFTTAGGQRIVRAEGVTEVVSGVSMTTNQPGTIVLGTSINIQYDASITNGTGTLGAANVICTIASLALAGDPCPGANFTITFAGSTFTIAFVTNVVFGAGDSISVGGVRVNAAATGAGITQLNAAISSVGDPITNLVTYQPTIVPVATVLASLKNTIPDGNPGAVLTCGPPTISNVATTFSVKSAENFAAAMATAADEEGFSDTPVPTLGTQIDVILTGIPNGFTVTPTTTVTNAASFTFDPPTTSGGSPGTGTGFFAGSVKQTSTEGALTFSYVYTGTPVDLAAANNVTFSFNIGTLNGAPVASGGTTGAVTAKVRIGGVVSAGIVRFVDSGTEGTVASVNDCVTRLLYSWGLGNFAGYETGIAISNTTEDDLAYGADTVLSGGATIINAAVAQNGSCKLVGYPSTGGGTASEAPTVGTPVSFTTPTIAAGSTWAWTVGGLEAFDGFRGYILAVCQFLNAHSFAFITDGSGSVTGPTLAQGFQALVVSNTGANGAGSRVIVAGEALGQ